MIHPRVLPVGDAALTVELSAHADLDAASRVRGLDALLANAAPEGLVEWQPTLRSLLVLYDPDRIPFPRARELLLACASRARPLAASGRRVEIPVRYDGADLDDVARRTGFGASEVARRHAAVEYTALMLGFLPGFAYLGPLDPALVLPRRATPRPRVPAGAVGIAGDQTGVYPSSSPGGWHLLGSSPLRLFEPGCDPPALVRPGDRVRFVASSEAPRSPAPTPAQPPEAPPAVEVVDPGPSTAVQGASRRGWRRYGVVCGGAADAPALAAANAALGNPGEAAGLETAGPGLRLRFRTTTRFAWAGADLGALLIRDDLGAWPVPGCRAVLARAGNELVFTQRRAGLRAYLAIAGGVAVPEVLGATSTDFVGGFGGHHGRALRAGDLLGARPPARGRPRALPMVAPRDEVVVRAVSGPQDDAFAAGARRAFFDTTFVVDVASDRIGLRLGGARLEGHPQGIVSDGMVPGCVQVSPDGRPTVMLVDGPTTGGYPKIATVVRADLPLLAQLLPGAGRVRFVAVDVAQAQVP